MVLVAARGCGVKAFVGDVTLLTCGRVATARDPLPRPRRSRTTILQRPFVRQNGLTCDRSFVDEPLTSSSIVSCSSNARHGLEAGACLVQIHGGAVFLFPRQDPLDLFVDDALVSSE